MKDLHAQRSSQSRLVIVPGLHGSGAEHWQGWLHGQIDGSVRVEQDFWSVPDIDRWADRVAETVDALGPGPHVIAAHSFGCLAALQAAARHPGLGIAQMLLVAPAEPTRFDLANMLPPGICCMMRPRAATIFRASSSEKTQIGRASCRERVCAIV